MAGIGPGKPGITPFSSKEERGYPKGFLKKVFKRHRNKLIICERCGIHFEPWDEDQEELCDDCFWELFDDDTFDEPWE